MRTVITAPRTRGAVILLPAFLLLAAAAGAFSEPTAMPPGGNVAPPLNTGTAPQTKAGGLTIQSVLVIPTLCLAGDCRSIWPEAPTPAPGECKVSSTSCPSGTSEFGTVMMDGAPYGVGRFPMVDNGPYRHFERRNDCLAVKSCSDKGWTPAVIETTYNGFVYLGQQTGYPLELACNARTVSGSSWSYQRTYECRPPTARICCY